MYARGIGALRKGLPQFFLGDEDEARQLLFALLIPNDDFDDVFIELCGCILSRHFELVSTAIFYIDDINLLIELWGYHCLNLKSVRVESMYRRAPAFRNCLSVLGVLGYVARIFQAKSERKLSGLDYRIFHTPHRL